LRSNLDLELRVECGVRKFVFQVSRWKFRPCLISQTVTASGERIFQCPDIPRRLCAAILPLHSLAARHEAAPFQIVMGRFSLE
jgi:hypothetical protein